MSEIKPALLSADAGPSLVGDPWFARWRQEIGFPSRYCCFKLVTTGLDEAADLIIEVGLCFVRDNQVHKRYNVVLDWTQEPAIDLACLRSRLEETARQIQWQDGKPTGRSYPLDFSALAAEGMPPRPTLTAFAKLLDDIQEHGEVLVAHNGFAFDVPFLVAQAAKWLGMELTLDPDRFLDTAMLEKAALLGLYRAAGESLGDFWQGVSWVRAPGTRWSLHNHCLPKYGLTGRYQEQADRAGRADQEAFAVHLLLQEFRRLGTASAGSARRSCR